MSRLIVVLTLVLAFLTSGCGGTPDASAKPDLTWTTATFNGELVLRTFAPGVGKVSKSPGDLEGQTVTLVGYPFLVEKSTHVSGMTSDYGHDYTLVRIYARNAMSEHFLYGVVDQSSGKLLDLPLRNGTFQDTVVTFRGQVASRTGGTLKDYYLQVESFKFN